MELVISFYFFKTRTMNLSEVKDWIWIMVTLGGLFVTAIGYTYTVKGDIKRNRELREEDKKEILKEIEMVTKRVDKVEIENSQTLAVLTEIKVQLSAIETTLKLFIKK